MEDRPFAVTGTFLSDLLLGLGEPERALELFARALPKPAVDARFLDGLMVRSAAAAAELVRQAADERDQAAVRRHRAALDGLVAMRDEVSTTRPFEQSGPDDTSSEHERRCSRRRLAAPAGTRLSPSGWRRRRRAPPRGCSGSNAAPRAARGGVRSSPVHQDERWRTAAGRAGATRSARGRAFEGVGRSAGHGSARVAGRTMVPLTDAVPAPFVGLTPRETEVLAHLVANRTNAEIAGTLFISEKTVSVHVSNLLRKTETGSRREVAALARRLGWVGSG